MKPTQLLAPLSVKDANEPCISAALPSTAASLTSIADSFDFPLSRYDWFIPYDYQNPSLPDWSPCYNRPMSNLWHAGEDWGTAANSPIKAVANGTVVFADPNYNYKPGRVIVIRHELLDGSRIYSMYGHLATMLVSVNASVTKGQVIGTLLNQGWNSHLHWELRNFEDGSFICSTSGKPGPGYTYPMHPDTKGYRNPSQFIKDHRVPRPSDNADIQQEESDIPTTMQAGETRSVRVRVANNGTTTWTPESLYRLGAVGDGAGNQVVWRDFACGGYMEPGNPANGRVYLCSEVPPGGLHDFRFNVTAPSMPGGMRLAVQMVRDGIAWFGESYAWPITVEAPSSNDNADVEQEGSDVPILMQTGETRAVRVRVVNNGTTTWSAGSLYRLGAMGIMNQMTWHNFECGGYMNNPSDGRVYLCSDIPPGGSHEFRFNITAPGTPGNVRLAVQMVHDGVTWFGESYAWPITVTAGRIATLPESTPVAQPTTSICDPSESVASALVETTDPVWIFGMHADTGRSQDDGFVAKMVEKGRRGWIVFTEEIGCNPSDSSGIDYRRWSDAGHGVIVRLNNGYGATGTLPYEEKYQDFAMRCGNFVAASSGCHIWIIGNEPNLPREWPGYEGDKPVLTGQAITVARYVDCYRRCRNEIKSRPGRQGDIVCPAAAGTYAPTFLWRGVEGFMEYWRKMLQSLGPDQVDGLILHAYTRGNAPALITDESKMDPSRENPMDPPYETLYKNFLIYRNHMQQIQRIGGALTSKPVWITETSQVVDEKTGLMWDPYLMDWMHNAYREINNWNSNPANQKILGLCPFRWTDVSEEDGKKIKNYCIPRVPAVVADWQAAMDNDYRWTDSPVDNAAIVRTNLPTQMQAGQTYRVAITVKNMGASVWSGSGANNWWRLGAGGGASSGNQAANEFVWSNWLCHGYKNHVTDQRCFLCNTVSPGQEATFEFDIIAPSSPGVHRFSARMIHDGERWFGQPLDHSINVAAAVGDNADIQPENSSIPTSMQAGETRAVRVRVYNNGSTTWSAGALYRLGALGDGAANQVTWRDFQCGGYMESGNPTNGRVYLCAAVPPGGVHDFNFNITAPNTPGTARVAVRMVRDAIAWFGETFVWDITITSGCQNPDLVTRRDIWKLEIWNNRHMEGATVEQRYEGSNTNFSYDWGGGGPSNCTGVDNFSVRFSRQLYFDVSRHYTFTTTTDDGVCLYLDGNPIINRWLDQPRTDHRATLWLNAGYHDLRMDYYENGGGACAALNIS